MFKYASVVSVPNLFLKTSQKSSHILSSAGRRGCIKRTAPVRSSDQRCPVPPPPPPPTDTTPRIPEWLLLFINSHKQPRLFQEGTIRDQTSVSIPYLKLINAAPPTRADTGRYQTPPPLPSPVLFFFSASTNLGGIWQFFGECKTNWDLNPQKTTFVLKNENREIRQYTLTIFFFLMFHLNSKTSCLFDSLVTVWNPASNSL